MFTEVCKEIHDAINDLSETPRPFGHRELPCEDATMINVGKYQVVYEIMDNKEVVLIIDVRVGGRSRECSRVDTSSVIDITKHSAAILRLPF